MPRHIDAERYEDHFMYAAGWALDAIEEFLDGSNMWRSGEKRPPKREFVAHAVKACNAMYEAAYGEPPANVVARVAA